MSDERTGERAVTATATDSSLIDGRSGADEAGRRSTPRFAVVCELGHGGMADVLLAIARGPAGFNKLVVLKQIRQSFSEDAQFLEMLLNEARLAAQLNHPNIVQTNEVGVDAGRHYIAMEYLEGQPLSRLLRRLEGSARELPIGFALRIACDALLGLHYAHELTDLSGQRLGIIHRDVSPHNLCITYTGQVKLLDFGLAKAMSSSVETQSGVIRGKLYYMAPEQAAAQPVDPRSDIFSLGVVLWEMLTGHPLWRGQTDIAVACNLRFGEIPRLSSVAPDLPKPVAAACMRAIAFRPEERFQTAAEFRSALLRIQEELYPRVTNEEIGALVSELFAEERNQTRGLIEARMRSLATPEIESPASATPSSPVVPPKRGALPRTIAVTMALMAFGSLATLLATQRHHVEERPVPTLVPHAPQAGDVPADDRVVQVDIQVYPASARIFWDGRPLETNPFRGQFERDGSVHDIRAEAPGFLPFESRVVLDGDTTLELPLAPVQEVPTKADRADVNRRVTRKTVPAPEPRTETDESTTSEAAEQAPERETVDFVDPWGGK